MHKALGLIDRFRRDRRGNIAVIFAISCVPLITAVGCAVDYSNASRIKAKLQSAADAASVAAISQKSAGYIAASLMTTDGTIPAGVTDATNVFNGNVATIPGYAGLSVQASPTPTVTKTGIKLASNVSFTAQVPVTFLKAIGYTTLTVTGSSTSNASLPPYLDFYLTLDVSGSMGLPSTTSEAQRMQYINPDNIVQYPTGCTLACHFSPQNSACTDSGTQGYPTNGYCMGYAISRVSQSGYANLLVKQSPQGKYPYKNLDSTSILYNKYWQLPSSITSPTSLYTALTPVSSCSTAGTDACIQLRLDAVGYAVNQLLTTANSKEIITNQFRIGIYPFILDINPNYAPLTSSINGSPSTSGTINYAAANLATELDTNMDGNLGSGGTHIDNALNSINGLIKTVGNGSASNNTLPYVFLVTDGAEDPQSKGTPNGGWSGSNHAVVLSDPGNSYPNICTTLKSRGIIVSVLYVPYQVISPVNASFANDEDDFANNNIPNIPKSLSDCASPADAGGSYFYTANTPTDIQNSLNAMFNHSLQTAHITN
jgi:Flp pilus assembly protein TadG